MIIFVSDEGNKKLARLNASSTMGALYKDDVKNIDVIMPSYRRTVKDWNIFSVPRSPHHSSPAKV